MNRKALRAMKTKVAKSDRAKPATKRLRRSAIVAALFSSFAIGLGHLYAGRLRRGLAFAAIFYSIVLLGALLGLWPTFRGFVGLLIALFAIYVGAIVDAARQARLRRDAPLQKHQRWYFYLAAAVVLPLLANLVFGARAILLGFDLQPVTSSSMSPALEFGDQVLIDTRLYRRSPPQKGDLIASRRPIDDRVTFHRVIGVAGESVRIDKGRVYLNDKPLDANSAPESAAPLPEYINLPRTVIPENQLLTFGGLDEHGSFALLRIESVIGQVSCVWMSPDRARVGMDVRPKREP
jgi:signal peptidase I